MRAFGTKSILYSVPRYTSVCPACRPKPCTSVTVMPWHAGALERLLDVVELEGLHDGSDQLHPDPCSRGLLTEARGPGAAATAIGIPHGTHRRRVAEVEIEDLLHVEPSGDRGRDHVDALGRASAADDLSADHPARASLGEELHADLRRVRRSTRRWSCCRHQRRRSRNRRRWLPSRSGRSGRSRVEQIFVIAVPTHTGERGVAATDVDASHAACLLATVPSAM